MQRLIDLLREVVDEVKEGSDPRLPLELALVKVCRPQGELSLEALQQRLERLEGGRDPRLGPAAATASRRPGRGTRTAGRRPPSRSVERARRRPGAAAEPAAGAGRRRARWRDGRTRAARRSAAARRRCARCWTARGRPRVDDGVVALAFSLSFAKAGARSASENEELLTEVLGQALGGPVRLQIVEEDVRDENREATEPIPTVEPQQEAVSEDDLFDQIKEAFDAHEVKESR